MAITISSQSAYNNSYQSSYTRNSSNNAKSSSGYYSVPSTTTKKSSYYSVPTAATTKSEPETPQKSAQAASYDSVTDLYNYAKSNYELSKLSLFDHQVQSLEPSTSTASIAGSQSTPAAPVSQSSSQAQSISSNSYASKQTDSVKSAYSSPYAASYQKATYAQNAYTRQSKISSYMNAENNYRSMRRSFDASV